MLGFITKKSIWINLLTGIVIMVAALFLLNILLSPLTRHGKNKEVPAVLGLTYSDARKVLEAKGFEPEIQDSIYTDTVTRGIVLKQFPEGGDLVKVNRKVFLTINRQVPPEVEMPNLIGFSFRNAEMQLKNMGLRVGPTSYKPDFAKNSVLEQNYKGNNIEPGTKIRQGSLISLVLGDGFGRVEFVVPNLIGMRYADAKSMLEQNGLSFLIVLPDPDVSDTSSGFIYWQSPPRFDMDGNRTKIKPGQTMDVRVGLEPPVIDSLENIPQG